MDMPPKPCEPERPCGTSPEESRASAPICDPDPFRPVGRVAVGCFAGLFSSAAIWVLIVSMMEKWTVAEALVIPSWICVAILSGWTAYSSLTLVRVGTWALAGLGMGLVLEAILAGGLDVGTWLTPSGIILGVVFAILGYRRRKCNVEIPDNGQARFP